MLAHHGSPLFSSVTALANLRAGALFKIWHFEFQLNGLSFVLLIGAYMTWKTCDEESDMLAGLIGEAKEKTAVDQQQIGKPIAIELGERTV